MTIRGRFHISVRMFTIIGGDGKEYGPATVEQIRGWIAAGRANLDTQAKVHGTDAWKRLGDFPEFDPNAPAAASSSIPSAAPSGPATPVGKIDIKAYADAVNARAGQIDVMACLSRSFELWKNNFLTLVAATALMVILQAVVSAIPVVGGIASILTNGAIYAGLYYFYVGKMRGQPREFSDLFAGFSHAFVPLMLASLILTAATILIMGPTFGATFAAALIGASSDVAAPAIGGFSLVLMAIGLLAVIYISVAWAFGFLLVIDKGLGPWAALEVSRRVVSRQFFRVLFVVLLGLFLAMLGLIGLIIGIIFTLPLFVGAVTAAYETLFNPPTAATVSTTDGTPTGNS